MSFDIAKNIGLQLFPLSNFNSREIANLYAEIWRDGPYSEVWTEDTAHQAVSSMGDNLLVATFDDAIIGFIAGFPFIQSLESHPDFFCATPAIQQLGLDVKKIDYLAELAVMHSYRGLGYGASLLQSYVDYVIDKGCEGVLLRTHASNRNPALPLYKNFGFTYLVDQTGKRITTEVNHPRLGNIPEIDHRPFHLLKL
ncbi:GNAT family N-acetyltransferase [Pseudoalteromonas phenolica]|uniref:GNAT family N-acetyltransferase n=1 Tax=Pseudoalteromonas phenolica TaxID=161398 RepID=UPI00384D8069